MEPGQPAVFSTPRFVLQRLILVDSYTEGRISELPLEGGCTITGRNGRGKTSLLQLIPAFYGERPDRIVRPVSNKQNFARYYLPRSTSYIVYEYRRDNVTCCAVLFSDETGDSVQYRFFRSAFRQDFFVRDDERTLVVSTELPERMKLKGVSLSRKMPLDEYRAIIQGKMGRTSDRAWLRQMIADYAFCPSSHALPHIERIVYGMFLRKTNFQDLQRMVVSSITDSGNQIALGAERKKIEVWPDAFDGYREVMAEASRMEAVQQSYDTILAAEGELRHVHARLIMLDRHLEQVHEEDRRALEAAQDELREAEDAHRQAVNAVQIEIERTRRDAAAHEEEIRQLDREQASYEAQGVKAKAELLTREQEITQTREQLEARKSALIGKQTDIEHHYQAILVELERGYLRRQPEYARQREQANAAYEAEERALQSAAEARQHQLEREAQPQRQALQQAVDTANMAVGGARSGLEHPQPDPALVEQQERAQSARDDAQRKWMDAKTGADQAHTAYQACKAEYEKRERDLDRLRMDTRKIEEALVALRLRATPGEQSLLYALRTQRPDWTQDIAKVLRDDLLLRTDLSPRLGAIQESIYGLQLDLELLEAPLAANEAALQQEIELNAEQMHACKMRIAEQEQALHKHAERLAQAREAAELTVREMNTCHSALDSVDSLLKGAQKAVKDSRAAAQATAQAAHEAAQRQLGEARARQEAFHRQLEHALREARETHQQALTDAQARRRQSLDEIKQRDHDDTTRYQGELQEIERERNEKLKHAGVDTAALQALEQRLEAVREELETIAGSRQLVAQWQVWLNSQWAKRPFHQQTIAQARADEARQTERKQALEHGWEEAVIVRRRRIAELATKLAATAAERARIADRRKPLEPYAPDDDTLRQPCDPTWSVLALIEQANQQDRAIRAEEARLAKEIAALRKVFVARRGSPPDQYAETRRQEMGPDRADKAREWVPAFKAWYAKEHETYRGFLRIEARTIADAVADFHDRMKSFHLKVQQFNRELQENLNANLGFESIGSVSIEIVSSIRELDYWKTIEQVAESRLAWIGAEDAALPPPAFALSLRELLEHWQLRAGIQAELGSLIRVQGEVIENGTRRPFRKAEDLETISSHGLSYIVMVLIFIGFINRVRGKAPVNVVWALDEIKDLDIGNIELLMEILTRNHITLVSACPDPDPDVLAFFRHRRSIRADRYIYDPTGAASSNTESVGVEREEVDGV